MDKALANTPRGSRLTEIHIPEVENRQFIFKFCTEDNSYGGTEQKCSVVLCRSSSKMKNTGYLRTEVPPYGFMILNSNPQVGFKIFGDIISELGPPALSGGRHPGRHALPSMALPNRFRVCLEMDA